MKGLFGPVRGRGVSGGLLRTFGGLDRVDVRARPGFVRPFAPGATSGVPDVCSILEDAPRA